MHWVEENLIYSAVDSPEKSNIAHESWVLIAYAQKPLNVHADVTSGARGFGVSFHLFPYFMYEKNEGFGETVHMSRLV